MTATRAFAVSLAVLTAGAGCHSPRADRKNHVKNAPRNDMKQGPDAPSVSHDVQLLGKLLKLPAVPLEASFEEVPLGTPGGFGPTDYQLVAVLRFDAAAVARLTATSPAGDPAGTGAVPVRPWFPAALKAKVVTTGGAGGAGGEAVVQGRAIDATAIFRPRYSSGAAVLVEGTDYVVLSARTS
jgi:hypothetical protein